MAKKTIVFGDPASYPDPISKVQEWWREDSTQKWLHPSQRRKTGIKSVRVVIEIEQEHPLWKAKKKRNRK
jgi:hypothetical protein